MSYHAFMEGLGELLFVLVLVMMFILLALQLRSEREKAKRAREGIIVLKRPTNPDPRFAEVYDKLYAPKPSQDVYDQEKDEVKVERNRIVPLKNLAESKARIYSQVSEDRKQPFEK